MIAIHRSWTTAVPGRKSSLSLPVIATSFTMVLLLSLLSWLSVPPLVNSFGLSIIPRHHRSFFPAQNCFGNRRRQSQRTAATPTAMPTARAGWNQLIPTTTTTTTTTTLLKMRSSLVGADDSWGNLATLSAVGVLAQNLGNSTKAGRLLGAPVTAMAITFVLASVGVLTPGGTMTSRNLQGLAIRFATPWILLGAEFGGSTRQRTKTAGATTSDSRNDDNDETSSTSTIPLLFGFGIASLASLAGGLVGWRIIGKSLALSALGQHDGLAIVSALLAKNIGGGINYVAVCAALSASPEAIATGLCIDNIGALVYFPISNALAGRYPDPVIQTNNNNNNNNNNTKTHQQNYATTKTNTNETNTNNAETGAQTQTIQPPPPLTLPPDSPKMTAESISVAFFAASALLWMGDFIAIKVLKSPSAQIPVVTLLAVFFAGIVAPSFSNNSDNNISNNKQRLLSWVKLPASGLKHTCDVLGTVCLYLFFTTAGAPGIRVARSMTSALWPLSVFSVALYAIHGGILASCYQLGSENSSFRKKWEHRRGKSANQQRPPPPQNDNDDNDTSSSWKWRDIVSPQRLLVASSSAIGGPPTSVALARTAGWDSLVVPALLVGNIGYAISTFVGIAFYYFFK